MISVHAILLASLPRHLALESRVDILPMTVGVEAKSTRMFGVVYVIECLVYIVKYLGNR